MSKFKIKHTKHTKPYKSPISWDLYYTRDERHFGYITVNEAPTSNCQLFTIGDFQELLYLNKEEFLKVLDYIRLKLIDKKMLLLDINYNNLIVTKKLFKNISKSIINKKYTNSNGNTMVLMIIHLDFIKYYN